MEDADPDYLHAVEVRFAALRGRGFMLSAKDVALVEAWRARGVPLRVVLRVLEDGVRTFRRTWRGRQSAPVSLSYFSSAVDAAALKGPAARQETAEPPSADPGERLLGAIEAAGRRLPPGDARQALRRAWRHLRDGLDRGQDVWALTPDLDAAIVLELKALMPTDARAEVSHAAAALVTRAGGEMMTEEARRAQVAFEVERLIRARWDIPELMEILLETDV